MSWRSKKKARVNAEAGYSAQKNALRMANLTALLQSTTPVPEIYELPGTHSGDDG